MISKGLVRRFHLIKKSEREAKKDNYIIKKLNVEYENCVYKFNNIIVTLKEIMELI